MKHAGALTIGTAHDGRICVLTSGGDLDFLAAAEFLKRGHATVVVDKTLTRFCDSYGLQALLRAHKLAQADGGELRLVTPADGVVPRIFALTCLDRLIPCFASLKEALAQTPAASDQRRDERGPEAASATTEHDRVLKRQRFRCRQS
jgi:anti-anti-sigma factor